MANGQQPAETIVLDFFTKIPPQIDGCSGLYTYDSLSLQTNKYVFVTNLQDAAFIKVAGKQIALQQTGTKILPKNTYRSTFKGNGYTVILTTRTLRQTGEEAWVEGGTIEISHGTAKRTIKIHGESGC
jgi:hypothetical protein